MGVPGTGRGCQPAELVAVRYAVAVILLAAVTAPRHGAAILRTHRLGLVLLRGVALASASVLFGLGLTRLAMMRYAIDDIRLLQSGDLRFLTQF